MTLSTARKSPVVWSDRRPYDHHVRDRRGRVPADRRGSGQQSRQGEDTQENISMKRFIGPESNRNNDVQYLLI